MSFDPKDSYTPPVLELPIVQGQSRSTVADIVNARRIINGPRDKLRAVSATKYPWARPLWAKMRGNRWEVEQVQLVRDKQEFETLDPRLQQSVRRTTAFLSNLDAIQTENLAENVSLFITDPSISQLLARQTFEEWIHVEMYSAIVETLFKDPLEIYNMYEVVPELGDKNSYIISQSQVVNKDPSPENKVKAIVSNIVLEGIYFFSGFLTFYAINRGTGKLNGCTDGIKYIQRDELTHLEIFINTYNSLRAESPEIFTSKLERECIEILDYASQLEVKWLSYVIDGGIPGVTVPLGTQFIQNRARECGEPIGLKIHSNVRNPISWFDTFSNVNGTHGNFFESKPTNYTENRPTFSRARRSAAS